MLWMFDWCGAIVNRGLNEKKNRKRGHISKGCPDFSGFLLKVRKRGHPFLKEPGETRMRHKKQNSPRWWWWRRSLFPLSSFLLSTNTNWETAKASLRLIHNIIFRTTKAIAIRWIKTQTAKTRTCDFYLTQWLQKMTLTVSSPKILGKRRYYCLVVIQLGCFGEYHWFTFLLFLTLSFSLVSRIAQCRFFKMQPAFWGPELISSRCSWILLVRFFFCYPLWLTLPRNTFKRQCWQWGAPLVLPFWHHRGVGSDLIHTRITRKMSHTQAKRTKPEHDAYLNRY